MGRLSLMTCHLTHLQLFLYSPSSLADVIPYFTLTCSCLNHKTLIYFQYLFIFHIFWLKQGGLQKSISPFFLGGWSALCMKTVLCGCLSAHVVCPLVAVCLSVLLFVGCEEHDNETMILGSFLSRHTHSFNLLTSKFNLLTSHFRGPRSQQAFDEGGMHTRNHTCQFRVNYEIKFKSVCWNQSSCRKTQVHTQNMQSPYRKAGIYRANLWSLITSANIRLRQKMFFFFFFSSKLYATQRHLFKKLNKNTKLLCKLTKPSPILSLKHDQIFAKTQK